MQTESVVFKGSVNLLTIILREEDGIDHILEQIENKIGTAGKFFKGASLNVKYRGKKLNAEEVKRIFELLSAKSGAEIKNISEEVEERAQDEAERNAAPRIKMNDYFFKGIDQGPTRFFRGTVRSGQLVSYEGNLVIIGDVNPGGEVVASGNIAVMGSVRGLVHAGADGNRDAIVAAFSLQPVQLRIADVITRPPDENDVKGMPVPEMAYVKGNIIYIERYLPQR